MSARIESVANRLLTIKITGKLTQPEWVAVQNEAGRHIDEQGSVRVLVLTENFEGWERGGDWGDLAFQAKYDKSIERMAIVADRKWEDLSLLFTAKGFRPFPIEFFPPGDSSRAQAWVTATNG